ncbi:hypothetical protein WA158_001901 [Blastocystis sp. Blastoise]
MKFSFTLFLALICLAQSLECSSPQVKILITRTHQGYASQEGIEVWDGTSATGIKVFSANGAGKDNTVVTYEMCLYPRIHTFAATDGNNDGWANGSIFEIKTQGGIVICVGTLDRYSRQEWTFYPYYSISSTSAWKYSNQAQSGNSWTQANFADTTWTSYAPGTFPAPTSTTRYFRASGNLPSPITDLAGFEVGAYAKEGVVIYVNGQEVYRRNLPQGTISATTVATAQDTDYAFRRITGSTLSTYVSASVTIAVEIHSLGVNAETEQFKGFLIPFAGACNYRAHSGTMESNHANDWASQKMDKLWDHDLQTAWYFKTVPAYNTYIFNDGRRELVRKYVVRCSSWGRDRDPKNWELLGSNDGISWTLLDAKQNVYFLDRRTPYEVELPNNNIAYNMIKFNVLAVYNKLEGEISEVEFFLCNTPIIPSDLTYSASSYTYVTNMDTINLFPRTTGYNTFTITPALPTGVNFNANTGRINGIPTTSGTVTYTITATYAPTQQQSTTTITIATNPCPETSIRVDTSKYTARAGSGGEEKWQLYNAIGTLVYEETGITSDSTSGITQTTKHCLPRGQYKFVAIAQYSEGWSTSSTLTVTLYYRTFTYPITRIILRNKFQDDFYVNLSYITAASIKSIIGVQPDPSWKNQVMTSEAGWTDYNYLTPPSATQPTWWFRQTYTVLPSDISAQAQIFEYRFRVRAGAVIYLDGQLLYTANVPEGEVTPATRATSGRGITEDAWWRSVTGPISQLPAGTHVFSVVVVHKLGYQVHDADYDNTLRILSDTNKISHSWRMTAAQSSTVWGDSTTAASLFDGKYSTSFVAYFNSEYPAPRYGQGSYWEWRAEMVNKYCVVSGYDGPQYDPKSWKLQGSDDAITFTDLSTVNNAVFNYRSQPLCFYMPTQTKAWRTYRIEVTELSVPNPDNDRFVIGQLELYALDFNKLVISPLAYPSNSYTGYVGAQFTSVAPTSEYYFDFTISPALPAGLYINTGSGNIYGTPNSPASGTYTITAMGPSGSSSTVSLSINIQQCTVPNVLFSLTFSDMASTATQNGFEIKNNAGTTIDQYAQFPGALTQWYASYCQPSGVFELILKDGPNDGWGEGKVTVKDADGKTILTATCNYGEAPKSVYINLHYLITEQKTQWKYTSVPQTSNAWNVVTFSDATWSTSLPGSFSGLSGTTQYYRSVFNVDDISKFAFYELMLKTNAGIAAYLNGKLIYTYNLPHTFTSTSYAINPLSDSLRLLTSDSVQFSGIIVGQNVLAVEIHKTEEGSVDASFDSYLIFQMASGNRIVDGIVTTNYAGLKSDAYDETEQKAFDGSVSTKYNSQVCGNSTYLQWNYNNNRKEYINSWTISRGNNANRLVTLATLSGSNDGETWTTLNVQNNLVWGAHNTAAGTKTFDFYNDMAYNKYRVTMFNPACSNGYELSEIVLGTKKIEGFCKPEGQYGYTLTNQEGYRACDSYYSGGFYRLCSNGVFGAEQNKCVLDAPKAIQYNAKAYVFYTNKASSSPAPVVRAAEATITINPALPEGLSINSKNGVISGKPRLAFNMTDYTVTTTNTKGSATATVTLSAINSGEMSVWVIVLIVIASIIIIAFVGVVIFIVLNRRKGSKKGNHNKLGAKGKTTTPTKASEKKVRI